MKKIKIDLFCSQYGNLNIKENETLDNMITRFIKITNSLSSLGDSIDNDQKVRKVIRVLPQSWEIKSTANRIERQGRYGLLGPYQKLEDL